MNRSSAIVGILGVAGVKETTQLASIENARSLDYAQVSDSVRILSEGWQDCLNGREWSSSQTDDALTVAGSI